MEILKGIRRRIDTLAASLEGQRVGVYPADYGRFAGNIGELLAGFDVVGLHHPDSGVNWQGLPFVADLDEFLDGVDVVLLWGVDAAAAEMLYQAHQRNPTPRVINVLDTASDACLLGPRRGLHFSDLVEPCEADQSFLVEIGLDMEALRLAFGQWQFTTVRQFAKSVGRPELSPRFDGVLAGFEAELLEHCSSFFACPFCGRTLVSDQAFLVRQPELHFVTAHRFVCPEHEEFHLFKTLPILVGLYLPAREVFLNARPRDESMRYMFFEAAQLAALVQRFKLLVLRHRSAVERYVAPQALGKKPLALVGNYTNLGHHYRNELAVIQAILDAGLGAHFDHTLVTLRDCFDMAALFPELPPLRRLAGQDAERLADDAFRHALEENLLPVMLHYGGDFQETLARRMLDLAASRASPRARELVQTCISTRLSLWITLRSTRAWESQNAGFISLLARLRQEYPELVVVFDGLKDERLRMEQILAGLPGLAFADALGLDHVDTIHVAAHVTLHISPLGSGATFLGVANVPGVFHGSQEIMDAYLLPAGPGNVASLPRENPALNLPVFAVEEDRKAEMHVRHYELNVDELHAAVLAVLGTLRRAPRGRASGAARDAGKDGGHGGNHHA